MRKVLLLSAVLLLLTGCSNQSEIDLPMKLRTDLCAKECSFDSVVTADYGEKVYSFSMKCTGDTEGNVKFEVMEPESISHISGNVTAQNGTITFDGKVLVFPVMCEGLLTPVSAPWHFLHTLRSGYIAGAGKDGDFLRVMLDDSYEEDALHVDAWLDRNGSPVRGEIYWKNRRLLTVDIHNFKFL